MLYGQTARNRNWKIQDGGLQTSSGYILVCKQDSNDIPAAIRIAYVFGAALYNKNSGNVVPTDVKKLKVDNTKLRPPNFKYGYLSL